MINERNKLPTLSEVIQCHRRCSQNSSIIRWQDRRVKKSAHPDQGASADDERSEAKKELQRVEYFAKYTGGIDDI